MTNRNPAGTTASSVVTPHSKDTIRPRRRRIRSVKRVTSTPSRTPQPAMVIGKTMSKIAGGKRASTVKYPRRQVAGE